MKKIITLFFTFIVAYSISYAQIFYDDFESYTINSYLGPQSPQWTTWSNADGSSEDVFVVNTKASSGSKSIYFNSPGGGGPNDVVLPFGGVNSSGRFKFSAKVYIPAGKGGYFNFQAGAFVGSSWAMELYLRTYGTLDIYGGGSFSTTYPQDRWFELTVDADLDKDVWEILIDNVSMGTFTNALSISYLDIFPADANSEYWMDDISYCINNACNPELSLDNVTVTPSTICTNHNADVTVKVGNHSSFPAKNMILGVNVGNNTTTKAISLNNLGSGKDTTISFPGLFVAKTAGTNMKVKAFNVLGDLNPANDTATTTVNVNASPSNTTIAKGTPFTTTKPLTAGTVLDPDIVAESDVLTFDIIPPTGYLNSTYGSSWTISGVTIKTKKGGAVSSSYINYTPPSGTNGKISFSPDVPLTDSTVVISFSVSNISTGCDSLLSRYIYIAPRPKAGATVTNVCDKQSMLFNNTSTILSGIMDYAWDFGDGTTSNFAQPSKIYAVAGTYTVKLIVTSNFGYKDSLTKVVDVYPIPDVDFGFVNACEGTAVALTDRSTLPTGTPTFEWDFGTTPASNGTGATTSKLYNAPGIYLVKHKVTVNGCSATSTKYVTQAPRTSPDFTFPAAQCDNAQLDFDNLTGAPVFGYTSYLWKFGDGNLSTATSPSHTYNVFNTFNVVLISNTNLGCKDSIVKAVTMRQSPAANFTMSPVTCSNDPIDFTNTSVVPSGSTNTYEWDFGDGDNSTIDAPTHKYNAAGDYKVVLKSSSTNGCDSKTETNVTISVKPTTDFNAPDVCQGKPTAFNNGSTVSDNQPLTYIWHFGNGDSSTSINPAVTYAAAGTYNITLVSKHPSGCSDTKTGTVKVNEVPTVTILGSSGNGGDGSFSFTTNAAGTGYTYYWLFGDGGSSTLQSPVYTFKGDGRWTVELKVTTPEGCSAIATENAWVNKLGINNAEGIANVVNVYPNPSAGKFVLDFSKANSQDIAAINVTDMLGRTLESNIAIPVSGLAEIDLSGQAAGIYYLNISAVNGANYTVKLTVSK